MRAYRQILVGWPITASTKPDASIARVSQQQGVGRRRRAGHKGQSTQSHGTSRPVRGDPTSLHHVGDDEHDERDAEHKVDGEAVIALTTYRLERTVLQFDRLLRDSP